MSKKLFAFDLDGTLLRGDKSVSERAINAINKLADKGHLIGIATARPPRDVARLLPDTLLRQYTICYNGAEIYKGRVKIMEQHISPELAHKLVSQLTDRCPALFIGIESQDTFHVNQSPVHLFGETAYVLMAFADRQQAVFNGGITKLIYEGVQEVHDVFPAGYLDNICAVTHTDNGSIVQIMANGVSKWAALQKVAHGEQIPLHDIVAFGDDHNDLAMLTSCGMGVAMANSAEAVLAAVVHTTASNDDDGVAVFLETNFLS